MATRSRRGTGTSIQSSVFEKQLHEAKQQMSARYLRPRSAFAARAAINPAASPRPEDNIVGIGVGEKITNGISTGVAAVKVFVRVKYAKNQIGDDEQIPDTIGGLPVDVEQIGTVRAAKLQAAVAQPNPRVRMRPARPGSSVGFAHPEFSMAGTFGAVVRRGTKLFILSNNHVLADENNLPIGSPIFQPGFLDGGTNNDGIARLSELVELAATNKVDAAIAAVAAGSVSREILFIGAPNGKKKAAVDMNVHKFGRTTSYRVGRVTSIDTDIRVSYTMGELLFTDQIVIRGHNGQAFSDSGDSGSLILERETNAAVGLLFAGSTSHTIANHIDEVLTQLNVRLA